MPSPTLYCPFMRERLPDDREAITKKFTIIPMGEGPEDRIKVFLTTGFYPDERLGEVFVKVEWERPTSEPTQQSAPTSDRMGSLVSGALDGCMIAFSIALQNGAQMKEIAGKFIGMQFKPAGKVFDPEIPSCTSLLDLIGRYLMLRFPEGRLVRA